MVSYFSWRKIDIDICKDLRRWRINRIIIWITQLPIDNTCQGERPTWLTSSLGPFLPIGHPVTQVKSMPFGNKRPSVPNGGNDKNTRYHRYLAMPVFFRQVFRIRKKYRKDINTWVFRSNRRRWGIMVITRLEYDQIFVFFFPCVVLVWYQFKILLSSNLVSLNTHHSIEFSTDLKPCVIQMKGWTWPL